jgi:dihydropteroate synthase
MQEDPRYDDLVEEVFVSLEQSLEVGEKAGLPRARMIADVGIGFGKTVGHNLFLLKRLNDFRQLGVPILVGTSRKSFLGKLSGGKPAAERVVASAASVAAVALEGTADFVRVHDVAETLDAVRVADAIRLAHEGGDFFAASKDGMSRP